MPYNETLRAQKKEVVTEDGSITLYSCEFDEAYHSDKDGALRESLQKHVIPALTLKAHKTSVRILDICFGLGYNTLATLLYVRKHFPDLKVHILSPEMDETLVRSLKGFDYPAEFDTLKPMIDAISENFFFEDDRCKIEVIIGDARQIIPSFNAQEIKCDIIYQDAFSPRKNPLLWTREWFADIRRICHEDAMLTTYSTAAVTRMGLYENGFTLYEYQGSGVRKSMIASLTPLKRDILALKPIDMAHKIAANPNARSLRDSELS